MQKFAAETGERFEALDTKPELAPHLEFLWRAYGQIRTDRAVGLDKGPIPFASIDRFAERYGIGCGDIDEFDRFADLIRAMDRCEMTFKADHSHG